MGKYMRKAKVTSDVVVMDVSQSSLGVRTRAKTLALQRQLQSSAALHSPPPPSEPESCYLELRSRRLVKPLQQQINSRKAAPHNCGCSRKETRNEEAFLRPAGLISGSIEAENLGIEASFGENNLDCQARERSTRESTPCSSTKGGETGALVNVPTARELEELFAREEESQKLLFMEKYNFDIVNDLPLPGRYEWVKVRS